MNITWYWREGWEKRRKKKFVQEITLKGEKTGKTGKVKRTEGKMGGCKGRGGGSSGAMVAMVVVVAAAVKVEDGWSGTEMLESGSIWLSSLPMGFRSSPRSGPRSTIWLGSDFDKDLNFHA